jgi:hypothetical protein
MLKKKILAYRGKGKKNIIYEVRKGENMVFGLISRPPEMKKRCITPESQILYLK